MPYITSVEKFGIEKGIRQGIRQGVTARTKESIIEILEIRFGKIPFSVLQKIDAISDVSDLKKLQKKTLTEFSIEKFQQTLNKAV